MSNKVISKLIGVNSNTVFRYLSRVYMALNLNVLYGVNETSILKKYNKSKLSKFNMKLSDFMK